MDIIGVWKQDFVFSPSHVSWNVNGNLQEHKIIFMLFNTDSLISLFNWWLALLNSIYPHRCQVQSHSGCKAINSVQLTWMFTVLIFVLERVRFVIQFPTIEPIGANTALLLPQRWGKGCVTIPDVLVLIINFNMPVCNSRIWQTTR